MSRCHSLFTVAACALLAAGCGGGGGAGGVAATTPVGGIDRSGQSVGPVTGLGSVFVNGIEFDTRQAQITVNGQSALERDLKVGQVVTVTGTRNDARTTGTASAVSYHSDVEGPLSAVDLTAKRLTVLGQTVQVDDATVFAGVTPADITGVAVNDNLEVSGLQGSGGGLLATRIEKPAPPATLQVRGRVTALDTALKTFAVGAQVVDYSGVTLIGFPGNLINNGDQVEVSAPAPVGSAALRATRVAKVSGSPAGAAGAHSEIEGLVTRFASASDFDVAGQKIVTTAATRFESGTAADIRLGARIEAEGTVDGNGALVADQLEVKAASNARVAGRITGIDSAGKRLTVLGKVIATTTGTQYEDRSTVQKVPFGFADLLSNDFVEVRGVPGSAGVDVVATRIERQDANAGTAQEVRGRIAAIDAPNFSFVVTGVTVTVAANAELHDRNGQTVTRAAFFALLQVNTQVRAHGTSPGPGLLTATEVELDDG